MITVFADAGSAQRFLRDMAERSVPSVLTNRQDGRLCFSGLPWQTDEHGECPVPAVTSEIMPIPDCVTMDHTRFILNHSNKGGLPLDPKHIPPDQESFRAKILWCNNSEQPRMKIQ